jgi:hypothetical protein
MTYSKLSGFQLSLERRRRGCGGVVSREVIGKDVGAGF